MAFPSASLKISGAVQDDPDSLRSRWTLRFAEADLERAYRRHREPRVLLSARIALAAAALLWLSLCAVLWWRPNPSSHADLIWVAPALAGGSVLGLLATRWWRSFNALQWLGGSANALTGVAGIVSLVVDGAFLELGVGGVILAAIFAFNLLGLRFTWALLAVAPYVLAFGYFEVTMRKTWVLGVNLWIVFGVLVIAAVATYLREGAMRTTFAQRRVIDRQQKELAAERAKSEDLIANMLPASVSGRLKESSETIAEAYPEVTVLFADLVGFTVLSHSTEPRALVAMLDDLFSDFDVIAARHGVEKIKTIGDAYMAASGVPIARDDHAEAALAMARDMLHSVEALAERTGYALSLRVGLHSGPVVAGVIGKHKYAYDLWGDTVNIASRMESHGIAGAVQLSEQTHELVKQSVLARRRDPIDIKGKGLMTTYLVDS